ncbi:HD domain-containing protein [Streptomyces argyrophylli]|uniref:HD domain-containing protein n=1 Tax=Streptomyces argyrophylli TaxID=2726118 RepID=UPI002283639C|nr:HD domain-containing protein [Streptomyces argyrophyllae]
MAARAQEAAAAVREADRDLLVAAAWLHDIGYAVPRHRALIVCAPPTTPSAP